MAVRIAGVTLPEQKRIGIALTYLYGVGRTRSGELLARAGVDSKVRTRDLTEKDVSALREALAAAGVRVEGELRRDVVEHIRRLKEIGSFRGTRHIRHLPARGQRTRTNSRTVRGNVRRTAGSGRRSAAEKK